MYSGFEFLKVINKKLISIKNEKISNLIKKLNIKYNVPKNVTFYKLAGDILLAIKSSKTVKDNNLKNENKIIVLDDDP